MFLIKTKQAGFADEYLDRTATVNGFETEDEAKDAIKDFKKEEFEIFGDNETECEIVEVK